MRKKISPIKAFMFDVTVTYNFNPLLEVIADGLHILVVGSVMSETRHFSR